MTNNDNTTTVALIHHDVKVHLTTLLNSACTITGCCANSLVDNLLRLLTTPPALTTLRVNSLLTEQQLSSDLLSLHSSIAEQYRARGAEPSSIQHHTLVPDVLLIPNTGPRLDGALHSGKVIIVGLQCGMSVLRGADVFAPGVLAAPKSLGRGDQALVYADLEGKCRRGLAVSFDEKTLFVGVGVTVLNRDELFGSSAKNCGVAVQMTYPLYVAPSLNNHHLSLVFVQNLPSILASHILGPKPGEQVLDMCAAPGGKTTHLAMLMKDKGCLIALDRTKPKVAKLEQNVQRFNLSCVHCYTHDSTKSVDTKQLSYKLPCPPPYPPEMFDRILLDGPCSALGQRPQACYQLSLKELCSYQLYQRKLFKQAVSLLKPGGVMVYSTCSISPEENECQVYWALQTFPCLELAQQDFLLGYPGLPGYGLTPAQCNRVQRFGPPQFFKELGLLPLREHLEGKEHEIENLALDTVCFFIAKFIKK